MNTTVSFKQFTILPEITLLLTNIEVDKQPATPLVQELPMSVPDMWSNIYS